MTTWFAPFTGGDEAVLPAGLEFVVTDDPLPKATAISADADPYDAWEKVLVSKTDLETRKYSGYYLVIKFEAVNSNCERC
jgi:hypothetical protein